MLRALFLFLQVFVLSLSFLPISFAELTEEQEKCQEAIDEAREELARRRNADAQQVNTATTGNGQQQQQGSGNPIADMMSKIAEGNQKKAEVAKQEMEQQRQVNTEQFKQVTQIEDKLREIEKEKSKLPIEANNATFARRKQQAEIHMKCQEKAEKQYSELVAMNGALASKSQYAVESLSKVRGTRGRMRSQRKLFYDRCVADPATQEALQLAIDELDTKIYNFKIQSEIHNADLEYTKSKIPKLLAHMDENRRYIAQSADMQMNAIDQQQQMQMMGLGFALMTSSMNSGNRQNTAGTFRDADTTYQNIDQIRKTCSNPDYKAWEVPSDVVDIFSKVNRTCRPSSIENPELVCVKSSGQKSTTPRSTTNQI